MSKLSPLSLPRFDAKALARTTQARQAYPGTQETLPERAGTPPGDGEASGAGAEAGEEFAPPTQTLPDKPQVDTAVLLASLEKSIAELQHSATVQCHQAIAEFLNAAFPRLVDAFLAEEVAMALQTLAPPNVEKLNIRVPAELKAPFQRSVENAPHLSQICEIHPTDMQDKVLVDVDWSTGGVRFDMDQFLNSSLGRLSGLQNP